MKHWTPNSLADAGAPRSAEACGLGDRFRFWRGASGRRYLFSSVAVDDLAGYCDGVVIIACADGQGGYAGVEVIDLGAAGATRLARRLAAEPGLSAFVHLLAEDSRSRSDVVADLLGATERVAA